jgi:hypothetical protein
MILRHLWDWMPRRSFSFALHRRETSFTIGEYIGYCVNKPDGAFLGQSVPAEPACVLDKHRERRL